MIRSKSRGQRRRFKTLSGWIDKIEPFIDKKEPFKDMDKKFDHFHVPKTWIKKTEEFIAKKPKDLSFCKVVAAITYPNVRDSQIIIFYDEQYYKSFWDRTGPYQIWTPIKNKRSFAKERGIVTHLPEIGYIEELDDEDYHTKSYIWFYGEWL